MQRALLIHGWVTEKEFFNPEKPSPSNAQWIPWVQKQLLMQHIHTQALEMPEPYAPKYAKWKHVLEQQEPDADTHLVGYSLGGGFLLRWLSETGRQLDKVILVAPWLDIERQLTTDILHFDLVANVAERCQQLTIFYSTDDMQMILKSVERCREMLENVTYREFSGKGHFLRKQMGTDAFPELVEVLI